MKININEATTENMLYDEPNWDIGVGSCDVFINDDEIVFSGIDYELNYDTRYVTLAEHSKTEIKDKIDSDEVIELIEAKLEDYYE